MKKTISVSIVRHDGELNQALKRLAKTAVYVGIAAGSKDDTRNDGEARATISSALCMRTVHL
jgi:hypothetical protein